jgi:glutamate-5-semialdehyde dehydrogenase
MEIKSKLRELKLSQTWLKNLDDSQKSLFLKNIGEALLNSKNLILEANQKDLDQVSPDTAPAFRDRLKLDQVRIEQIAKSLLLVSQLPEPLNKILENKVLPNGLKLTKVTCPLGVILFIFESRPNVLTEALSLAFKSGNCIVLRGGKETNSTTKIFEKILIEVFAKTFPNQKELPFLILTESPREFVKELLQMKEIFDVVIPRGGEHLIDFVVENTKIPVIKNDRGMCHAYIDQDADIPMATEIVLNAKLSRPSVCNSLETVLIHQNIADSFLKEFTLKIGTKAYLHVCTLTFAWLKNNLSKCNYSLADEKAWDTEYLDFILNIKIIPNIDSALSHIAIHGSHHSEAILTKNQKAAHLFQKTVDAAAVYWNASTRFTDGYEFGLGGEIGISTQKLHVYGPLGLEALTSSRWLIEGTGQIRV